MSQRWFEVRLDDGVVVGVSSMALETAESNLPEGCALVAYDPAIDARLDRWTEAGWERGVLMPMPRRKETDYQFLRRTGYDTGAQVGVLMKIVEALLIEPSIRARVPKDIRDEFAALVEHNRRIKDENPKP